MNFFVKPLAFVSLMVMLCLGKFNGQVGVKTTVPVISEDVKLSSCWVTSQSKKFQFLDDFSEIKYKGKIYKVPAQISILPKEIIAEFTAIEKASAPAKKPVIYLYPKTMQIVNVKLKGDVVLTSTYPDYEENGWEVIASPDGTLTNIGGGRSFYCLYWEGLYKNNYDMTKGFVVKGEDTESFLEEYLFKLGLTDREANEFIIYWLPQMEKNKYNLIHFATDEYNRSVSLDITPKPDSMIRVLMVYKPLDKPVEINAQVINTPERKGFTVVEWGGSEIR
jgi:hypothetical protein